MSSQGLINFFLFCLGATLGGNIRFLIFTRLNFLFLKEKNNILLVNLISSFLIGIYFAHISSVNYQYGSKFMEFFLIGFIGSLSTFSTYIFNLFDLAINKKYKKLLLDVFLSIFLSFISLFIGYFIIVF